MTDTAAISAARAMLDTMLVWDNHACLPMRPEDESFLPQLERFRAAGADVVSVNIGFGPYPLLHHLRMAASFRRWIALNADRYQLVGSLEEIAAARAAGKLGIFFDVEGMAPLDEGDHGMVGLLYDIGVRWMLVAYNRNNAAGGGCHDDDPGLTPHGRDLLAEMKRVGMLVCCSHTGHRTVRDVFEAAENPVIFSHSNPLALARHARNIPDDLIRACAATGGVIGINGISFFLGKNASPAQGVAHAIDHVVQLTGIDHAGIGLDYVFDQVELAHELESKRHTFPDPEAYAGVLTMAGPEDLPAIAAELTTLGYAREDIAKVFGGNWQRVAGQVWKAPSNLPVKAA